MCVCVCLLEVSLVPPVSLRSGSVSVRAVFCPLAVVVTRGAAPLVDVWGHSGLARRNDSHPAASVMALSLRGGSFPSADLLLSAFGLRSLKLCIFMARTWAERAPLLDVYIQPDGLCCIATRTRRRGAAIKHALVVVVFFTLAGKMAA